MAFPFTIRYNKPLRAIISPANQELVLHYVQKRISEDKADNTFIGKNYVTYEGSTSTWRPSLFGSVDKGVFTLVSDGNQWYLIYEVYTKQLFIGAIVLSAFMGVFAGVGGGQWWVGIIAFLWSFGVNWLIVLGRHNGVVAWIVTGIDEMICGKEPEGLKNDKEEPERLKSWF